MLTNLVTPDGTNPFTHYDGTSPSSYVAVRVKENGLRSHLFVQSDSETEGKIPTDYNSYRPTTTNGSYYAIANTLDAANSHNRNSYFWGPQQYDQLASNTRTKLDDGTFVVTTLTSCDYNYAHLRHWLKRYGTNYPGRTLSLERAPSPDGTRPVFQEDLARSVGSWRMSFVARQAGPPLRSRPADRATISY